MEPGRQRENPPGSGEPESGERREPSAEITSKTENTVVAETDKEELEHLNQASDEINRVELQLDEARSSYRRILTDSARKLNAQGSQLGACIEKARPYYEARRLAKEAQQETQKAALRYERAVSMHTAAREMVYVAEQGLLADRNTLDPTWQEMLNHATAKVNEAEEERLRSEREHQRVTQLCQEAEARVQTNLTCSIQTIHFFIEHKSKVVQLEERMAKVKTRYSVALRNLEQISEHIHAQRGRIRAAKERNRARGGRSSPVGAESEGVIQAGAYGGVVANPLMDNDWADQEKTRQWVEKHREAGWGQREKAGSDSMSVISLQTIASDLEKFDSVEHLGNLSDVGSIIGEEKEAESERGFRVDDRIVEREVANLSRQDAEKGASGTDREQESFVKQHHRSVSL
uniref:SH3 domain-binding protein 5 n=1 Tax=Cyprinus carpio TaxID=7962 RepID=A0A8C2FTS3_CYPCA